MEMKIQKQSDGNRATLSLLKRSDLGSMERSESRVQVDSGSGREGRVQELVFSLEILHKCGGFIWLSG